LIANPGFESSLSGWGKSDKRTTLARSCSVSHSGSCSAALARTRTGDALLDDSPNTVGSTLAGATYSASAWVRAPSGRTTRLRVREYRGGTVVRTTSVTLVGSGTWRQLVLTTAATSGGTSLSVDVLVSLAAGTTAYVDDVSLKGS
jgi:hypothetical protein